MIIAVDFDGTLFDKGKPNLALIEMLKRDQLSGNKVILWTCRTGESLTAAVRILYNHGLHPDSVNENLPEVVRRLRNNPRKIYADVYIDDKAVRV